jgi:hypothetical protein
MRARGGMSVIRNPNCLNSKSSAHNEMKTGKLETRRKIGKENWNGFEVKQKEGKLLILRQT